MLQSSHFISLEIDELKPASIFCPSTTSNLTCFGFLSIDSPSCPIATAPQLSSPSAQIFTNTWHISLDTPSTALSRSFSDPDKGCADVKERFRVGGSTSPEDWSGPAVVRRLFRYDSWERRHRKGYMALACSTHIYVPFGGLCQSACQMSSS